MALEVKKDAADQTQFDALAIRDKKPGYVYRWGRQSDMSIASHEFHGYEIVSKDDDTARSVLSASTRMKKGEDADTAIRLGDLVLMRIPQEKYDERMRAEAALVKRREAAVVGAFKDASRRSIPSQYHPEDRSLAFEERGEGQGYKGEGMSETEHEAALRAIEESRTRSKT